MESLETSEQRENGEVSKVEPSVPVAVTPLPVGSRAADTLQLPSAIGTTAAMS